MRPCRDCYRRGAEPNSDYCRHCQFTRIIPAPAATQVKPTESTPQEIAERAGAVMGGYRTWSIGWRTRQ